MNTLQKIRNEKLIAIIRASNTKSLNKVIESLYNGGFRAIEITLNTVGALEIISEINTKNKDLLLGVGTVIDEKQAIQAIHAGAAFILSPTLDERTIKVCVENNIPVIPGVMTPTEALSAYRWG